MKPLAGHAVFLLLVQMALLLTIARMGAEAAKRAGLPAVVGELASGIFLGPSIFGRIAPGAFAAVFPKEGMQHGLLEVVGNLGMVLLLLLTGLETDLRLLRNLGRAAAIASLLGMVIPFASGFLLGMWMPDAYVAHPEQRMLFSAFLATAMAISAMPVIAKILMDLGLTKRNIGLVILSAGVVDDTAGWLVLSVIAGAASRGVVHIADLGRTVAWLVGFLVAVVVLFPVVRFLMGKMLELKSKDGDLVLIVVIALLFGAATEHIGVHAVFGAFVAGTMLRQVPRLSQETVHKLESFTFSILAPIFFGIVGLKVDLGSLAGGGMLAIVLAVACFGKLVGCTLGARWGGLRFWESISIAIAMNARGAMELVVASIGLSLGILNQQMFSIIVVVAIVTSFMAPLGLRLTMPRIRMTEEEARRIAQAQSKLAFQPDSVRALLPTAGGEPTLAASVVANALTSKSKNTMLVFHVDAPRAFFDRFRKSEKDRTIDEHIAAIQKLASKLDVRHVSAPDVPRAIVEEAKKGYDLLVLGAKDLGSSILADIVETSPCHVLIVRAEVPKDPHYRRLFVPIDGGIASRVACELAVRYAEASDASLTIGIAEQRKQLFSLTGSNPDEPDGEPPRSEEPLARVSDVFRLSNVKPEILRIPFDPTGRATERVVVEGKYDLVIIGAENRAIQHRLFFGHEVERLLRTRERATAIVVPNIAKLG